MKILPIIAALALAGCGTLESLAPNTVAGFKANGIVGALDGAAGAVVASCKQPDGRVVRLIGAAAVVGAAGASQAAAKAREDLCTVVGAVDVTDAMPGDGPG